MNRRHFIKNAASGLGFLFSPAILKAAPEPEPKKNILFILADDLGWADLGCYGNPLHETPHLNQLASDGMRFQQAYTACAVCSPTRASIQTGKYPIRVGITDWIPGMRKKNTQLVEKHTEQQLPLSEKTIAETLHEHGYRCAMLGKWHLGGKDFLPTDQGYDPYIDKEQLGFAKGYFDPPITGKKNPAPNARHLTDILGDEAAKLIGQYAQDDSQPFFLMMNFHTVHTPIEARNDLREHYEKKLKSMPDCAWQNPRYAAMVHCLDLNIGKMLNALKTAGIAQDTIVIFTSDNGGLTKSGITVNTPLRSGKGYYYEGGIRVPTIIRWPDVVQPNSICDCPVISNDFYPTILDMLNLPLLPGQHLDGLSITPLLKQQKDRLDRSTFYWHYPHYHGAGETPCSAIRSGHFKLIHHYQDNQLELYNLKDDPGETNNLYDQNPQKAQELQTQLDLWLKTMNAYIPTPT